MKRYGALSSALAGAVLLTFISSTAWPFCGDIPWEPPKPVMKLPGLMKAVATVPTEEVPRNDGDERWLRSLSSGEPLVVYMGMRGVAELKTPPIVSLNVLWAIHPRDRSRKDRKVLFIIDESRGTGTGYNRLYTDSNGDGVFERSECVGLMDDPPPVDSVAPYSRWAKCLVFESFERRLSPDEAPRHFSALLVISRDGSANMRHLFINEGLRHAQVTLGGVECSVFVQNSFTGDYDEQSVQIEYGAGKNIGYPRRGLLSFNGRLYRLSASPRGRTMTVEEYFGETGTIAIEMDGAWKGATVTGISLGGQIPLPQANVSPAEEKARSRGWTPPDFPLSVSGALLEEKGEFRVPAGSWNFTDARISKMATSAILWFYDMESQEYPMLPQVSNGERLQLSLTAKPEMRFPARKEAAGGKRVDIRVGPTPQLRALVFDEVASVKRGDVLPVETVVTYSELPPGESVLQGSGLAVGEQVKHSAFQMYIPVIKFKANSADGSPADWLHPEYTLSDSSGKILAQGIMKRLGYLSGGYTDYWTVPDDIKVGETLTLEVTCDTGDFWGAFTGLREVTVVE